MKKLNKSIDVEVLGGHETFAEVYTMDEVRKMKTRYIGSDFDTDISVYERSDGDLIAVRG